MTRNHGFLVLLAVAALIAAGGLTTLSMTPQGAVMAGTAAIAPPSVDPPPSGACASDVRQSFDEGEPDKVPPGCCTTQCRVDKDCDKLCGKGNCACIQESSCCRRCVY